MFKIIKVTGSSLSPFFLSGDYVVVSTWPFILNKVKEGDVVTLQHPQHGRLIKKVTKINPAIGVLHVHGTHRDSVDSDQFGPLPFSSLTGKVVLHIRQNSAHRG